MQKIGQLQTYVEIPEAQAPVFLHPQGSDQSRLIKMRILAENSVNLFVERIDADPETGEIEAIRFLAHVAPGMEQLEFYFKGSFALQAVGGSIWLDTYDNTSFNVESVSPESFARLHEREERDPRQLEMEQVARHNRRIFEEQRAADLAEYEARLIAMEERLLKSVTPPSSAPSAPATSVPAQSASVSSANDLSNDPPAEDGNGGQS